MIGAVFSPNSYSVQFWELYPKPELPEAGTSFGHTHTHTLVHAGPSPLFFASPC